MNSATNKGPEVAMVIEMACAHGHAWIHDAGKDPFAAECPACGRLAAVQKGAARPGNRAVPVTVGFFGFHLTYRVHAKVVCSRMESEVRTSALLPTGDQVWRWVFGTWAAVEAFIERGQETTFLLELGVLGYDACDRPC